ncbi:hypothetical protein LP419_10620 [Massilia sp. H-1]|nr:hypothetical protein LP419_10620 [Massilia sp. H-1]
MPSAKPPAPAPPRWPPCRGLAIAVCCVLLAFAMTIIPLALFLFVMFMVIKFVVTAFDNRARRGPATPYKSADDQGE